MPEYDVVEAHEHLSDLIDRALDGQKVIITRNGTPVVEVCQLQRRGRPLTTEDLAFFDASRVYPSPPLTDPISHVQRMRDETMRV